MNQQEIVRSWKDEQFRMSLSVSQLALLPENPAGTIKLGEEEIFGDSLPQPETPSPLCVTVPTPCPESWSCPQN